MRSASRLSLLLALVFAACEDHNEVPDDFRVRGQAEGTVDTLQITCRLDLTYERKGFVNDPEHGRVIRVEWGGDAERTVLAEDGSGISLAPFMHSPDGQVHLLDDDRIEIVSPINFESGVPFYVELGRLAGRLLPGGRAHGRWSCAPFEVRGDSIGTVVGTWMLEPM